MIGLDMIIKYGANPVKGEKMITHEEVTSILLKVGKNKNVDELDFDEDRSEEFSEPFEYKDRYYVHEETKKAVRLYARTWKFGRDPLNKSNLWRVTVQPVENGLVKAEEPLHSDWCEKEKIFEYISSNPIFAGYKEIKGAPQRKRKSKKK